MTKKSELDAIFQRGEEDELEAAEEAYDPVAIDAYNEKQIK